MTKPIINEVFAANGAHSHWELLNENGDILWNGGENESGFWMSSYDAQTGITNNYLNGDLIGAHSGRPFGKELIEAIKEFNKALGR